MILHKFENEGGTIYSLINSEGKIAVHPTKYLRRLRINGRSSESQRQIAYVIKQYCGWIDSLAIYNGMSVDECLAVVTGDDILDWIYAQRKSGVAERTIHNRELIIKELHKWLTTEEAAVRGDLPWIENRYTKNPHKALPRFVTARQVITLLKGMHNESQRVASHFMFDTGARISELIRLQRSDLPDENNFPESSNYYPLRIRGSKPCDGNTFKMRSTIISRPMLVRIRRYHSTIHYKLARHWKMSDPHKPVF